MTNKNDGPERRVGWICGYDPVSGSWVIGPPTGRGTVAIDENTPHYGTLEEALSALEEEHE